MGKNDLKNLYKGNSYGGINDQPFGSADYFDDAQGEDSETVYLFAPTYDKSHGYAPYQLVKDEIIAKIQRDWDYIVSEAIRALLDMRSDFSGLTMPDLKLATETDEDECRPSEDECRPSAMAMRMKYKIRERMFNKDMVKIYKLITDDYCTEDMAMMIMSHPEFEDRINNNPVELLKTIEEAMTCLLYTSPSPRDLSTSRMPSSA